MSSQLPSNWITQHCPAPSAGQNHALDLACGAGRHSFWLAQQGWDVTGLDRDLSRVDHLADQQHDQSINWQQADLETGHWPPGNQQFDLIVVVNYLHRPLFDHLRNATRSGGTIVYETFMTGNEKIGRPRSPDFLLEKDELKNIFADWDIVAFQQGPVTHGDSGITAIKQAIVAKRPLTS